MSYNKHPTKKGHYQIRHYPNGRKEKQEVIVIRGDAADAALLDAQIKRESKTEKPDSFPQVSEVIPYYLEYYLLGHVDNKKVAKHLGYWKPYIGRLRFAAITSTVIEKYKHDRLRLGVKPTTINKELSSLSGLLKWAKKKQYCHTIEIERFPNKMTRAPLPDVPTREEVLALIDCMIWPRCGLFACLYYAGLRKSEAVYLKAEDVYLDRNVMIVLGKGNKQRVVPIVQQLRPFIEKRLKEVSTGLMWPTRTGKPISDLKKIIKLAKERAGLTRHIYPHLLRHSFGTHATMSGVGMRQLQNVMGHTTVKTTELYTTLSNEAIIDEVTSKFGRS